jgi:hypothetical protein
MAPIPDPKKRLFAVKNCQGSMILALWGQPCARLAPSRREKYWPNGGIAFAHHHGVGLPGGPRWGSWPPSGGPLKTVGALVRGAMNIMAPVVDPLDAADL